MNHSIVVEENNEQHRLVLAMEAERNKMREERDIAVKNHFDAIERAEAAESKADDDWLNAIGKEWESVTGQQWDTRDSEDREEAIRSNICALFDMLQTRKEAIALGSYTLPPHIEAQMLSLIRERDRLKDELQLTIAANHALNLLLGGGGGSSSSKPSHEAKRHNDEALRTGAGGQAS